MKLEYLLILFGLVFIATAIAFYLNSNKVKKNHSYTSDLRTDLTPVISTIEVIEETAPVLFQDDRRVANHNEENKELDPRVDNIVKTEQVVVVGFANNSFLNSDQTDITDDFKETIEKNRREDELIKNKNSVVSFGEEGYIEIYDEDDLEEDEEEYRQFNSTIDSLPDSDDFEAEFDPSLAKELFSNTFKTEEWEQQEKNILAEIKSNIDNAENQQEIIFVDIEKFNT